MGFSVVLMVACSVFAALAELRPSPVVPASAPPTEFSSARAMAHLQEIAREPRPTGSARHEAVRDYLVKALTDIGCQPQVQKTKVVENITAKIEGTGEGKAVFLIGHYDSVSVSPGAGDNGLATASILETLRALKAGGSLRNDVVALLTDGEEDGLLGAKAFVYDNPASSDIGIVFNFDARGNRGPVLMFETSEANKWLIQEFARAVPHPVANSLMYDIYKRLPNDTDFTVFKRAGYPGLNFACINGFRYYHTAQDTVENVSEATLQHQGTYMLSLARHFGNLNLETGADGDVVYFNLPGAILVHYSAGFSRALTGVTTLLFAGVIGWGVRRRRLSLGGVGAGFALLLLSMLSSFIAVTIVWWAISKTPAGRGLLAPGDSLQGDFYTLGLAAIAVASTTAVYACLRQNLSVVNLLAGALLWWWLLLLVMALLLPGGSYLFVWPLLFGLITLCVLLRSGREQPKTAGEILVFLLGVVPGMVLLVPMIFLLLTGLTLTMSAVVMTLVVLLVGQLIPQLSLLAAGRRWWAPGLSAAVGLVLLIAGWNA